MNNTQDYASLQDKIEQAYPAYIPIHARIFCDGRIDATDKLLILLIWRWREYRPDYDEIAWIVGIEKKTAQARLRKLTQEGYIRVLKNDGRGKIFALTEGW